MMVEISLFYSQLTAVFYTFPLKLEDITSSI